MAREGRHVMVKQNEAGDMSPPAALPARGSAPVDPRSGFDARLIFIGVLRGQGSLMTMMGPALMCVFTRMPSCTGAKRTGSARVTKVFSGGASAHSS
jgi:hypothetical protein